MIGYICDECGEVEDGLLYPMVGTSTSPPEHLQRPDTWVQLGYGHYDTAHAGPSLFCGWPCLVKFAQTQCEPA